MIQVRFKYSYLETLLKFEHNYLDSIGSNKLPIAASMVASIPSSMVALPHKVQEKNCRKMLSLITEDTANNNPFPTPNQMQCRLCHSSCNLDAESPNIYESPLNFGDDAYENGEKPEAEAAAEAEADASLIVHVCESLCGVKYERHEFLPERICERCLDMLKDFYELRSSMRQRECELQRDLKSIVALDAKYRPGLNGNPGVFEFGADEESCVIVDVDPDQLCETSDDEFLGSEGEVEAELEDEEWDDEDEEETQVGEDADADGDGDADGEGDVDMPLGMDAAQMAVIKAHQAVDANSNNAHVHPKSAFLCQYCDMAFTLQQDCQRHELAAHDLSMPFSCNYCQLRLSARPALIAHIRELHDVERPYVCAHCTKGFVRRSDLKKHTIVHTGVRPFSCNVCSKSFSRNTNLTKHLRIHSSVKPFVCQQCPRSFQTPLELMKHTRSHAEIKPYQCARCSASFARKDKLSMHQQVHQRRDAELQLQQNARIGMAMTAEQLQPQSQLPLPLHPYVDADAYQQQQQQPAPQPPPPQKLKPASKISRNFRCDICDRCFQRERDLQRHRALHMDTLFACKLCGQGFNRREQLHRHELEVHGPSFTCAICCISFLQQAELETHLKVHELQHSVAKSTQEALKAAAVLPRPLPHPVHEQTASTMPSITQRPVQLTSLRPTELSFYSNMIPTMNLGFYSETRPEERNGP